jgi:hypothetical protein
MWCATGCGRVGFDDAQVERCTDLPPGSASGTYELASGPVYCDMDAEGGGWARIADVDAAVGCPGEWSSLASPSVCFARIDGLVGGARSATFPSLIGAYTEVMGRVIAYQFGTPDAFAPGAAPVTIDSLYVDGMSISREQSGARQHVWTYAVGWSNSNFSEPYNHCPCDGGPPADAFIGSNYFCASGHNDALMRPDGWQLADPLYDGATPGAGCDGGGRFVTTLPEPTDSSLEARLMVDQDAGNEDMGVARMELFVR